MKIDGPMLEILKNFAAIQQHLVIRANEPIWTICDSKSIIACCEAFSFPKDMGIYDLKQFIGTLSLCEEPSLEFFDTYVLVTDDNNPTRKVKFFYAEASQLVTPKPVTMPNADVKFTLTVEHQKQIRRGASVLELEKVQFLGVTNECISVIVGDTTNPTANQFEFKLDEKASANFSIVFSLTNWKMLNLDYEVSNSSARITCFEAPGLKYFVGQDKSSKYGD